MADATGLGRVAVFDGGSGARRVARALRELSRAGQPAVSILVHGPGDRTARAAREADEAVEQAGSVEESLGAARADAAWLGGATLGERAAFAEACARAGVRHLGPPPEVLRRVAAPEALVRLAADLGVPLAPPAGQDAGGPLLEVAFARDAAGQARTLGVADVSLRLGALAVLSEAPSPALTAAEDAAARDLGARAAAATGWVGVGALRLRLDPATRRLALSTLDAEVLGAAAVEAATGADLVRLALRLAAGGGLGAAPASHGHAVAARLPVHDPEGAPLAGPVRVELLRLPSALGVRSEASADEGDHLLAGPAATLATLVARGEDRPEALARLEQALADADVLLRGSAGSKAWLAALCARPEVRAGKAGLGLLERLAASGERLVIPRPEAALVAAAIEAYDAQVDVERARFLAEARRGRPRVGPSSGRAVGLRHAGQRHRLEVRQLGPGAYRVAPQGGVAAEVRVERHGRLERRLSFGGRGARVLLDVDGLHYQVVVDGVSHAITRQPTGLVVSPMPAVVVALPVVPGQQVAAGEPVARIESMKVETVVVAPEGGVVTEVLAAVNGQVDAGGPLVRLQPLGEGGEAGQPLDLAAPAEVTPAEAAPGDPRARYLKALGDLQRLLLGFDGERGERRRLAAAWRDLAEPVPVDDPAAVEGEDQALQTFAELEWLYTRARLPEGGSKPPLEELWRYLHEPEARGAGLAPGFVAVLRRALSHYGVSMDAPGRELELALLRMQKAHDRVEPHAAILTAILERRLSAEGTPPGLARAGARELLGRVVDVGLERSAGLADLARELRYRAFDHQAFEKTRAEEYARAEADLARLAETSGPAQAEALERLVACGQPIATLLIERMAAAPPAVRPRLVEALLRRYYRLRPLEPVTPAPGALACAATGYRRDGQAFQVVACFAPAEGFAEAARRLAELCAGVPADRQLVLEAYLWQQGPRRGDDELAEGLRQALGAAGFSRPVLRCSVVLAVAGQGLSNQASQQHVTLRGGPVGSSRVDLQACKLEYSIVSPK